MKGIKRSPLLQLLRPPNLFTVPGDPLCGALLASHGAWSWRILAAIAVSLGAYCAGLVTNDLADFSEDLRDRPSRPLPCGAVPRKVALALALFFIVIALGSAVAGGSALVLVTVVLLAVILSYNLWLKRSALIGPPAMGLCRGLSVLAGASAIAPLRPSPFILPPFLLISLYIAGVTALARTETGNPRIPPLIGALIRGLLALQAGFCLLAGGSGWIAALLLLALWPLSRLVATNYYAS